MFAPEELIEESQILYEDNHLIVINKKSSEIVQGDKTGDMPLSDVVKEYIKDKYDKPGDVFLGVRMGEVAATAKQHRGMPVAELEKLLESQFHELRAGALAIMNDEARQKRTAPERRKDLYDLYLRRHDRINNWDLVDLAARDVIGAYVIDRPRDVLYELARSDDQWARRTAIYATHAFIKIGQLDDTFALAELLLDDPEDLMHKAVGGWLREAGKHDRPRLLAFLDQHAPKKAEPAAKPAARPVRKRRRGKESAEARGVP